MPGTAPQSLAERIRAAVAETRGGRVLVLGDEAWADVAREGGASVTHQACDALLALAPGDARRFDLAIVCGVLETLDPETGAALLARTRDLHAGRVLVAVSTREDSDPPAARWGLEQMLAHGLHSLGDAVQDGETVALYGFDIDRYKRTPDWLNPRNWANPQMWDRFRW